MTAQIIQIPTQKNRNAQLIAALESEIQNTRPLVQSLHNQAAMEKAMQKLINQVNQAHQQGAL